MYACMYVCMHACMYCPWTFGACSSGKRQVSLKPGPQNDAVYSHVSPKKTQLISLHFRSNYLSCCWQSSCSIQHEGSSTYRRGCLALSHDTLSARILLALDVTRNQAYQAKRYQSFTYTYTYAPGTWFMLLMNLFISWYYVGVSGNRDVQKTCLERKWW